MHKDKLVLLVDDEPAILATTRAGLMDRGFRVETVGGAAEAIRAMMNAPKRVLVPHKAEPKPVAKADEAKPGMKGTLHKPAGAPATAVRAGGGPAAPAGAAPGNKEVKSAKLSSRSLVCSRSMSSRSASIRASSCCLAAISGSRADMRSGWAMIS